MIELAASVTSGGLGSPGDVWHHIVNDFSNITQPAQLAAFLQVLMIDVLLAGDNAIVVGSLAAGLPSDQRRKVIAIGIGAALVLRIIFALLMTYLMGVIGLVLAGGLLLLWVAWKMWREIREGGEAGAEGQAAVSTRSFAAAAWSVALADVSMSLDNVLAVAGAAREHPGILMIGLILSVALMGIAANVIAKVIDRYRWIAYIGLAVIVYVAGRMIYEGIVAHDVGILQLFS
ncbi:YjbE family putative metal transport protein [Stakelama sp. CBK3Z-3]|uniref:YjbE family putative metal transport protein n=1 Tax=Stakelama flava TaxID=2860338 RepID=A0ABS6XMS9_9SPHN|nr:YjbE family putative metal transport protein [Stakelama flava]MBW4330721.1 YjbE family putative metal transport protein [Stakelama flava]